MLEAGKRLMLVSGTDYGDTMEPLIFGRGKALCGWNEPPLASVDGTPECLINQQGMIEVGGSAIGCLGRWGHCFRPLLLLRVVCTLTKMDRPWQRSNFTVPCPFTPAPMSLQPQPLFDGMLTRVISCELQYGPMNCDFAYRGTNDPVFDEATLPPVRG